MLRDGFADTLHDEGERDTSGFLSDPETALGAVLLFDQIPRNIYRGSAQAYAWDDKAQNIARAMLDRGWTQAMSSDHAQFALMPLMHSEQLADQDLSVEWFGKLAPGALDYARGHRDAIARFGRFPHRNATLGRKTTTEEQAAIDNGLSW